MLRGPYRSVVGLNSSNLVLQGIVAAWALVDLNNLINIKKAEQLLRIPSVCYYSQDQQAIGIVSAISLIFGIAVIAVHGTKFRYVSPDPVKQQYGADSNPFWGLIILYLLINGAAIALIVINIQYSQDLLNFCDDLIQPYGITVGCSGFILVATVAAIAVHVQGYKHAASNVQFIGNRGAAAAQPFIIAQNA